MPIEKIIRKFQLGDRTPEREDRAYWLSRPPEERLAAVDELRRHFYGEMGPIEKVIERIRPPWLESQKSEEGSDDDKAPH